MLIFSATYFFPSHLLSHLLLIRFSASGILLLPLLLFAM